MTLHTYRFQILSRGIETADNMRAVGRDEADAREKAAADPDLHEGETIGKVISVE
jgi:hypothetical protein